LNENKKTRPKYQEGLFTAISAGFFLLLVGILFVITPNLFDGIMEFFSDFGIVEVPNTDISFLGLESPAAHMTVYQAAWQLSIALAVFQVFVLALRSVIPSSWGKRSETVGNLVHWVGTSFLIQLFLIESTQWFAFWSTIIILAGVSLIARAAVMAVSRI
jgi:hypothetical protein